MTLLSDIRFAVRHFFQHPGFTATIVMILALGIGANAALFSVVNAVLWRELPVAEPERLVKVWLSDPERRVERAPVSLPDFQAWRERFTTIELLSAYPAFSFHGLTMSGEGFAEELNTGYVSGNFFTLLGVRPILGSPFTSADDSSPRAARKVVISEGFWQRQFGGDRGILQQPILLDGQQWDVAAVMPGNVDLPRPGLDVWVPLMTIDPSRVPHHLRQVRWLEVIGRLAAGVTPAQANAEANSIAAKLAEEFPESNSGWRSTSLFSLRNELSRSIRRPVLLLFAAVGVVLLIACANVATLLLARYQTRSREMAVRSALGAGRLRLARQLLTEGGVLAVAAGGMGILVASWGIDFLKASSQLAIPRAEEIRLDESVLAFVFVSALLTLLLFGLTPALRGSRPALPEAGAGGGARGYVASPSNRVRRWLVVSEVALAVVLVTASGLMLRSLWGLTSVDPGFESARVLAVKLTIPTWKHPEPSDYLALHRRLLETFRSLPGVEAAGANKTLPFDEPPEQMEFQLPDTADETITVDTHPVTDGFFEALRIPLREGRTLRAEDGRDPTIPVVVNRAMALRLYPDGQATGREVLTVGGTPVRVVGVVENFHYNDLTKAPGPAIFIPLEHNSRRRLAYLIRTRPNAPDLAGFIRNRIHEIDPDQPVALIKPLQRLVEQSTGRPRALATLLALFSGLGLLLATTGIYGLLAYLVNAKTSEIGVRMALGARRSEVLWLFLARGLRLAAVGLVIGVGLSLLLNRYLSSLLFEVSPSNPWNYLTMCLVFTLVALPASAIPAWRASRTSPASALRYE